MEESWALKWLTDGARNRFYRFYLPETVSTCNFTKKKFETISQILEPKLKKNLGYGAWVWSPGLASSRETSNVEGHSTTLSIPVKRWILAKAVEVLHHARNIWRIHQTSPCPQMYSRSHVSWSIQHVSKGATPLRAFALTSWYKAHTWLLVPC